jgi:hypothetical protein
MESFERLQHNESGYKSNDHINNRLQQSVCSLLLSQQGRQLVAIMRTGRCLL